MKDIEKSNIIFKINFDMKISFYYILIKHWRIIKVFVEINNHKPSMIPIF